MTRLCDYCGRPMDEVARWEVLDAVWFMCLSCCFVAPALPDDPEPAPEPEPAVTYA